MKKPLIFYKKIKIIFYAHFYPSLLTKALNLLKYNRMEREELICNSSQLLTFCAKMLIEGSL